MHQEDLRSVSEFTLPSDIESWLSSFIQKHGHRPRVLHIGNIANNAYNNAKLLNQAGLDCDVICYDSYHIMGCPEWEDADFEGDIGDQFSPDWSKVDLNGFNRPKWFAQGPGKLCIAYLLAKRKGDIPQAQEVWSKLQNPRLNTAPKRQVERLASAIERFRRRALLHIHSGAKRPSHGIRYSIAAALFRPTPFVRRTLELLDCFAERFPERTDKLTVKDLEPYGWSATAWSELLAQYDIVQGYSTDPIYPLLANRSYFAFEHGTLREIPKRQTAEGRITSLSYALSQHVFVTNADCLTTAHALAGDKVTFLNHPYDEDHGIGVSGWSELRSRLKQALDAEMLFFFPTRQDWVVGTGYADKANDIFIRAFCRLRKKGLRVGLVCCEWGANVTQSMALIAQYGCAQNVLWNAPMGVVKFERTAKACDVVVDQFKLGAFGGVMFKAMSVGAPICTYLDEDEMVKRFGEVPPVINCRVEDALVGRIEKLFCNQEVLDELSVAGRAWIKRHHCSADTVIAQLSCYMKAVSSR